MIFQHTLPQVLSGDKTQTSRVWKDDYLIVHEPDNSITIVSRKTGRRLYYVGQEFSVQPGRGKKRVGRAMTIHLAKRNVNHFTGEDIRREGFPNKAEFLSIWHKMHGANYIALVINFEVLE